MALLAVATLVVTQLTQEEAASTAPSGRGAASREFFGIGLAETPTASEVRRIARAGVRVARVTFDWRAFQASPDAPPAFTAVDPLVRRLAEAHIRALPGFVATPGWLASDPTTAPLFSAEARAGWRGFLAAAVGRYGPHGSFWEENPSLPYEPIRSWQIWNEENSAGYFGPTPSPEAYARLLHISAAAIRGADPRATIVLGGMFETVGTGGSILSWRFLRGLYEAGAEGNFDAVGVHPYDPELAGMAHQVQRIRNVIDVEDDSATPIWIDEIGWGSGTSGSKLNLGLEGQATMLRRAYSYIVANRERLGIGKLIWYPLHDPLKVDATTCGFCDSEGLFDAAGTAKPAWHVFRRFVGSR